MTKSIESKFCDVCGKEGGNGSLIINEDEYLDVCDKCTSRFASLAERIANPPKRAPRKSKVDKDAEAKNRPLGFVEDPLK